MTMNKDKWALAKKGATIVFRCGGIYTLESYANETESEIENDPFKWFITILGSDYYYTDNGSLTNLDEALHPFDIIDIIPAPEPKRFERFINVYKEGMLLSYPTKEKAEQDVSVDIGYIYTLKFTCTDDFNNPDPTIEVVKDFAATEGSVEVVR